VISDPSENPTVRHGHRHPKTSRRDHVAEWRLSGNRKQCLHNRRLDSPGKAAKDRRSRTEVFIQRQVFGSVLEESRHHTDLLVGIMKDDANGVSLPRAQAAHAIPKVHSIGSARPLNWTMVNREGYSISLTKGHDFGP
jgi:hypothetical protein